MPWTLTSFCESLSYCLIITERAFFRCSGAKGPAPLRGEVEASKLFWGKSCAEHYMC